VTDDDWMRLAIEEARRALAKGEVPIGSVIVRDGELVGRGHNLREAAQDPTAHAELIAVRGASARLGTFRLTDCTCFVTLEPCPMCAGMLVNARIGRLVFGATDPKAGAIVTLYNLHDDARLNHRYPATGGVLAGECGALLTAFFEEVRRKKREGIPR
jgi:tRNA(adenine34) deaminase